MSEKREMWLKILDKGNAAPSFNDWSVGEEAALASLEAEPVLIKETALGHLKEQHKHELLATYCAMSDMKKTGIHARTDRGGQRKREYLNRRRVRERTKTMGTVKRLIFKIIFRCYTS